MEAALRTASLPTAVTERHYTQQGRVFSSNVSGPPCQWIWTGGNDHWVRACDAMGGERGRVLEPVCRSRPIWTADP